MTLDVLVRGYEETDRDQLKELIDESIEEDSQEGADFFHSQIDPKMYFDAVLNDPLKYNIVVAEVDERIIGFTIGHERIIPERIVRYILDYGLEVPPQCLENGQNPTHSYFYGELSYVSEEFRGNGVGRKLDTALIDVARDQHHPLIWSISAPSNEISRELSLSLGYIEVPFPDSSLFYLEL
jgi:GNAT superfamily N-acetyltransferase